MRLTFARCGSSAVWMLVVGLLATAATPAAMAQSAALDVVGVTSPSEQRELRFTIPGVVTEVAVKPGDVVKEGQLLIRIDDRLARKELEAKQVEAESAVSVEAAKAELAHRKLLFANVEKLHQKKAASPEEYERAKLERDIAELKLRAAEEERVLKKLGVAAQEVQIELLHIKSPLDGIIRDVKVGVGELGEREKVSMIVVKNDPLRVEFHVRSAMAERLELSETVQVSYDAGKTWEPAKVTYRDPVINMASDLRLIRAELANGVGRPAGNEVLVRLPEKVAAGVADAR